MANLKRPITADDGTARIGVFKRLIDWGDGHHGDHLGVTAVNATGTPMTTFPVSDGSGALTIDSAQLPAALAASGGLKVEGVAGGVSVPVELVDEAGVAYGVKHIENKVRVSSMPYLFDIAEGSVPDHQGIRRFGHNADVGTSFEVVAPVGGLVPYLTAAETLQVVSGDANDDDADTGAWTMQINGLDSAYALQSEVVTLNGTSNVETAKAYLRVWQAVVLTAGTTGTNEGIISIKNHAAGATLLAVPVGVSQSHTARITVPAGKTFYLASWYASESSSKGVEVHLFVRNFGAVWRSVRITVLLDSVFYQPSTLPLVITEKSDIEIRAKGILAGANVTAGFDGWWE